MNSLSLCSPYETKIDPPYFISIAVSMAGQMPTVHMPTSTPAGDLGQTRSNVTAPETSTYDLRNVAIAGRR
jgi:hypothetical protein